MMVNEDTKEFSFGNLLNRSIFQNQRDININFLLPWMEKDKIGLTNSWITYLLLAKSIFL